MKSVTSVFLIVAMLSLALAVPPTSTLALQGGTIVVTSTADSGPSTLRQALLEAQSGDIITFDPTVFLPGAPVTITLTSGLPEISQGNLTIDASNAGVVLDGSHITNEWGSGLDITSDGNIIRGLQIINFPNAAVGLRGGAQNNAVGGDKGVGAGPLGQGNLLSGNGSFGVGIWDADTSFNTIIGNYIGTDLSGTTAWGIHRDGVHINGASHNQVTSNLISGNGQSGVYVCCTGDGNTINDNYIGTDASGLNPLGNLQNGVCIDQGASYNAIGPNNIIAHNGVHGIGIRTPDALGNTITQNSIHDNGRQGISLWEGGNTELSAPLIFDFDLAAGTVNGFACPNCIVEIFSDSADEGEVYEGQAIADSNGVFTFTKGVSFTGPHLTASATDSDGNTSPFSAPTSGTYRTLSLQQENNLPLTPLSPKPSQFLPDNHIGAWFEDYDRYYNTDFVYRNGFKRIRIGSLAGRDQGWLTIINSESLSDEVDETISEYTDNGVEIVLNLTSGAGLPFNTTTFQSEEEIERYLEYVSFAVSHFKGRIHYYEIWNEPGFIAVNDYANLVERVVEVIRFIDPDAKIIIGAIQGDWVNGYPGYDVYQRFSVDIRYLNELLVSGVVPLVDGISWHPFYDNIPSDPYYQDYPEMVAGIQELAAYQGFKGKYFADEILWTTVDEENWDNGPPVSQHIAAKYYARAIAEHRGLGVNVTINTFFQVPFLAPIRNLCDTLAGAEPTDTTLSVAGEAINMRHYAFSLPNGDKLVALWTNGEAVDDDPGIEGTLILPGFSDQRVMGIDVLHGYQQRMITSEEDGNLVIRDLLVKDYPIILRLSSTKYIFLPIVLKGDSR